MSSPPVPSSSHTARNVGVAVGAGVAIIAILFIFFLLASNSGGNLLGGVTSALPIRPTSVSVSGSVQTLGRGTHPTAISFRNENGQLVNNPIVNGQYGVTLPNDHRYEVLVEWQTAINSGTCDAGPFSVSVGPGTSGLTNNWSC